MPGPCVALVPIASVTASLGLGQDAKEEAASAADGRAA
jgi:hypothetical protein